VRPPVSIRRRLTVRLGVGRLFAMRIIVTARLLPVMAAAPNFMTADLMTSRSPCASMTASCSLMREVRHS
jgi:hypothetical protein